MTDKNRQPAQPISAPWPITDAWCRPGPYAARRPGSPYSMADLVAEHARYGIRRRVCLHAESREGIVEEGNAEMSRLAAEHPCTAVIWTALPPLRFGADPVGALMVRARAAGVGMFAMFPTTFLHHLRPWANGELYAAMAEARLPLALDLGEANLFDTIYEIASAHPALPLVLWGVMYTHERLLIPLMDLCPNVHLGLAPRFVSCDGIENFTGRYGARRVIYGSGWPGQAPGPLIAHVAYAEVDDQVKGLILGGSVRELLQNVAWPVHGLEVQS